MPKPQLRFVESGAWPRVRVTRGDKVVMGYRIECSDCEHAESITFTGGAAYIDPGTVAMRFRKLGWTVGRNRGRDECPRCNGTVKPKREETMAQPETKPRAILAVAPPAPDDRPMPLSMATQIERRGIMNALVENYDSKELRYRQDWTDERVGSMLGVAQQWVSEVREQFFGPDRSEADRAREATVAKMITALEELETRHLKYGEQIDSMRKSLDALKAGF